MNYCSHCGSTVTLRIPQDDNLPRHVCDACDTVHYENPKIVTGCVVEVEDKILLCRRAIQPRHGLWTVPAGFLEKGETLEQGAMRETMEEAQANVELTGLYAVYNIPHVSQVYVMFRGRLLDGQFGAGPESLEVELFEEHEIPWHDLAFKVIHRTLTEYYRHRSEGDFPTFIDEIKV